MTGKDLIKSRRNQIDASVVQYENGLKQYLSELGLPQENVLVSIIERKKVILNLPSVIEQLAGDKKLESVYLSKFVAAVGAGLFDAALNFVWDETVKALREKVVLFDIDYFFSSTITDTERLKKYKSQDDLIKLDDWELIKGCLHTGILSDLGYKHLDYIRNMRNWASAAHPNQNELTGLQIVSWLETCIKEVIAKEPSASAIEIKRLLHNIRNQSLNASDISPIEEHLSLLPDDIVASFLRTIFGMYTDPQVSVSIRNNLKLIAKHAWDIANDDVRYELGVKYRTFSVNAELQRRDYAREFIDFVGGLIYLPPETLQLEFGQAIQNLYNAHTNFNNFHNEPPHARLIVKYIPDSGEIPKELRHTYVKTIVMCAVGNGYGVSNMAYNYYVSMIDKFQDKEIYIFCYLPKDREFSSRLQLSDCKRRYKELAVKFKGITTNTKILTILELIKKTRGDQLQNISATSVFKSVFTK